MTLDQPRPILVLLSGGINSLAASMRVLGERQPHFLHVDHGHIAAENERSAATHIAEALAGTLHVVKLSPAEMAGNLMGDGHGASTVSAAAPATPDENRAPGIMLAIFGIAQQLAHRIGADTIVCGASQLCHNLDPDTRHVFHHAAQVALEIGSPAGAVLTLDIPFIDVTRVDVLRVGNRMGAPFQLSWSCHRGENVPCGNCRGCQSRSEGFDELGLPDPGLIGAAGRVVHGHAIG